MPGIIEESKVIVDQKKIEYQELLKVINYKHICFKGFEVSPGLKSFYTKS